MADQQYCVEVKRDMDAVQAAVFIVRAPNKRAAEEIAENKIDNDIESAISVEMQEFTLSDDNRRFETKRITPQEADDLLNSTKPATFNLLTQAQHVKTLLDEAIKALPALQGAGSYDDLRRAIARFETCVTVSNWTAEDVRLYREGVSDQDAIKTLDAYSRSYAPVRDETNRLAQCADAVMNEGKPVLPPFDTLDADTQMEWVEYVRNEYECGDEMRSRDAFRQAEQEYADHTGVLPEPPSPSM